MNDNGKTDERLMMDRIVAQPEQQHRVSRVINRDYVRRWTLDYAKENRLHPFNRVSEQFLNAIETATKTAIIQRVMRHPSKGKTLQ
jgi:hypothetical protein